ncbi:MAG: hypothetical protein COA57_04855 [Flavobacteriales bacterium]|nr:MAG: hypothetical protein COA57_04855 [Flavobacteriales bacterium]
MQRIPTMPAIIPLNTDLHFPFFTHGAAHLYLYAIEHKKKITVFKQENKELKTQIEKQARDTHVLREEIEALKGVLSKK